MSRPSVLIYHYEPRHNMRMMKPKTRMKIADFREESTPTGQISVPPEIAAQVPPGEKVAVVLAWGTSEEEVRGARQACAGSNLRMLLKIRFTNS